MLAQPLKSPEKKMFNSIKAEYTTYCMLDWAKLLLVVCLVVSIGLFGVNQFLAFRYKAVLFTTPCELCLELNDNVNLCPKNEAIDLNNKIILPVDFPTSP